jgi:hypothetical protein
MNSDRNYSYWRRFPGLVWSNAHASDSVMIMAALMRPRLEQLAPIAEEFGFDRVLAEWELLQEEDLKPVHLEMVTDILGEIEERMSHASGRYRSSLASSLATA